MLKTPEEYLSSFEPPAQEENSAPLSAGERVFVEKYLGMGMLADARMPEPMPLPKKIAQARPMPVKELEIGIAGKKIEVAPERKEGIDEQKPEKTAIIAPAFTPPAIIVSAHPLAVEEDGKIVPGAMERHVEEAPSMPNPEIIGMDAGEKVSAAAEALKQVEAFSHADASGAEERAEKTGPALQAREKTGESRAEASPLADIVSGPAIPAAREEYPAKAKPDNKDIAPAAKIEIEAEKADIAEAAPAPAKSEAILEAAAMAGAQAPPEAATLLGSAQIAKEKAAAIVTLRDLAAVEESVRMVSFYVENQLFLLPVAGIQEVLRHMELIKIPQAPYFIAGAINIRGAVTPLVHLSALLTNNDEYKYNERSFIIVYGSESLRLGLVIDRINSMHMLEREKIIWNVESRLGEAGDFLCAIANLDDRVCGIVAPEMITQKLLSSAF